MSLTSETSHPTTGGPSVDAIVDTQVHVWSAADEAPSEYGSFGCDDVLALLRSEGVARALLIPPRWSGFDNAAAIECARAHPELAVVGRFDPSAPGAREELSAWKDQRELVGVRLVLSHPPAPQWLRAGLFDGELAWVWAVAEQEGIPLTVFGPHLLPELSTVAERHPDLTLVVDHCGATAEKVADSFAHLPDLLAMARLPNVHVKVSSLPAYSDLACPFPDVDDVVRQVVDAFGASRCMWGSDVTRFQGRVPYGDLLDQLRVGCTFLSDDDRRWILGRTASTVYDLAAARR